MATEIEQLREQLKRVTIERDLWIKTALAAADYIARTPCDHDVTKEQLAAWEKYRAAVVEGAVRIVNFS